MNDQSFLQSPEFKRATANAADTGIKIFFKWVGILIKGIVDFCIEAVRSIFGKF